MKRKITVYSKAGCPQCVNAKDLLTRYDVGFTEVKIDENDQAKQFIVSAGHRGVPQFYVDEQLFVSGGWPSLKQLTEETIKHKLATYEKQLSTREEELAEYDF